MNATNKIPFPQANSIDKVLKLVNIENSSKLKDEEYLGLFMDVRPRQVQYYRSACQFLSILDRKYSFTKEGLYLRSLFGVSQNVELIFLILSNDIFLKAYINNARTWQQLSEYIKEQYNYSEAMYKRRSESAIAWLDYFELKRVDSDEAKVLYKPEIRYVFLSQQLYGFELEDKEMDEIITRFNSDLSKTEIRQIVRKI